VISNITGQRRRRRRLEAVWPMGRASEIVAQLLLHSSNIHVEKEMLANLEQIST
jgi:hypothetical protein